MSGLGLGLISTGRNANRKGMQYKKGEWMWILAMGSTIGVIAALTATGWFNALASAFIVTMIFDGVAYLAVRIGHVKMSEMSNFVMTLITAGAFYLGFKWIYPSVLKQYVGTLVPLSIVGCGISGGGCFGSNIGPVIQSSPGWYAVIAFVFFVLIAAFHGGWGKEKWDTPLLTATLAVGVVTLSVVTILTALMPWFWGTLVNSGLVSSLGAVHRFVVGSGCRIHSARAWLMVSASVGLVDLPFRSNHRSHIFGC